MIKSFVFRLLLALPFLPQVVTAQAYGRGTYGAETYGEGESSIIDVITDRLPDTGPEILLTLSSLLAIITAVIVYRRTKST